MKEKTITKILAAMLAFTLTFANVAILGIYTEETYAASTDLEEQSTVVSKADIEFDAYFLEEGEIRHSKNIDVGTNNEKLCLSLKVGTGYLANASIKIEDANFEIGLENENSKFIESVDEEANKIELNQIDKGESVVLEVPIKINTDSSFDVKNFEERTKVILEGTYVSENGKERKIAKEIEVYAGMTGEGEAEIREEVNKYVQYNVKGERGVVLQTVIKSKLKGNILPVKQTEIEIEIPKINGVEPERVVITANSTKATNGEGTHVYTEEEYRKEEGKIILVVENKEGEDGKVAWEREAEDEILVTYIYGEGAVEEEAEVGLKARSKISTYDSEGKEIIGSFEDIVNLKEEVGDIVDLRVETDKEEIQKGYMETAGAENTRYEETIIANIGNREIVDSIEIETEENYKDAKGNEYPSEPIYTYTKVGRENLIEMLGEDGYINILNKEGEIIATLNKDNVEYKYEEEVTGIKIETSKPEAEGIIKIENGREIKAVEYDKMQMKMFSQMEIEGRIKVSYEGEEVIKGESLKEVALVEPKTEISVSMNKTNLSTAEENTGIEIQAVLDTNDISKSLYKNPIITIEFPSYIEDLKDGKIGMLYGQGLTLGSTVKYKKEGKVYIQIPITGEQTAYNTSSVTNGAKINIYGSLVVNELTPGIEDSIKVYVTNEEAESYETEIKVTYVAENKVITKNAITGYDEENREVKALEGEETAKILPNAEGRKAEVTIDVVNSTDKKIKDIQIVGRIPAEGNTDVITGESLNSTFTAKMASKITGNIEEKEENIKIYYSNKENAKREVEEDWTEEPEKLGEIKSYLIDLTGREVEIGDRLSFEYGIDIPGNIGEEKETYSTFAVYYTEESESEEEEVETKVEKAGTVGLKTTEIAETDDGQIIEIMDRDDIDVDVLLSTSGQPMSKDAEVKEGQFIDYTVTVKNKTDKELTFDIEITKENGTFYGLYTFDTTIDESEYLHKYGELKDEVLTERITIKPDSTIQYKYCIVSNENTQDKNLISNITIKQNDIEVIKEQTSNKIINGLIKLNTSFTNSEEWIPYSDSYFPVTIAVSNISGKKLSNIEVTMELPETLSLESYQVIDEPNGGYTDGNDHLFDDYIDNENAALTKKDQKLIFNINSLEADTTRYILLTLKVAKLDLSKKSVDVAIKSEGKVEGEDYSSNVYKKTVQQSETAITAYMTGSVEGEYVKDGDLITYTIEITNIGLIDDTYVIAEDNLPEGLRIKSYSVQNEDEEEQKFDTKYNNLTIREVKLKAGTTSIVKITAEVVEKLVKDGIITNSATISGIHFDKLTTNEVTYKLKKENDPSNPGETQDPNDPNNPDNPSNPGETQDPSNPSNPVNPNDPNNPGETQNPNNPSNPGNPDIQGGPGSNIIGEGKLSISGLVWKDINSDGQRTPDEEVLKDIPVNLMNNKTSKFMTDKNGNIITVMTDSNGLYKFDKVPEGEYIVVFGYDTQTFTPTIYKASGIKTNVNSDAISQELTIDGVKKSVAVTDIINLSLVDANNIDLGLKGLKTFDLKLDKIINTVIVQNKQGTKTFTFKNNKLAKVEIPSKYMKGSNITVEYKISVTNEGEVAGKVGKIVDYIPKDMTFSSEINNEWYKDRDGNVYTEEFANEVINPGETKEVTLVLTKVLKEETTELTNNTAEIAESYNTLGLEDIDSTAGNKSQKEDDLSSADMIITIKTGAGVYIGIVLGVMFLLAMVVGGIYIIKRKVLVMKI